MWLKLYMNNLFNRPVSEWSEIVSEKFGAKIFPYSLHSLKKKKKKLKKKEGKDEENNMEN